jgi:uracil-DNA glycosylase
MDPHQGVLDAPTGPAAESLPGALDVNETPGSPQSGSGAPIGVPLSGTSDVPSSTRPHWLTATSESIQAMELMAFDQDIHECQNCPLGKTRKRFVFGSGNPQAEVMFVGEAPGADEDEKGLPFVGKAGQLLTKIIESTQTWKRPEVFICNVLKCRPPGNRTPMPEEVEQCRPYLEEQIRIINPKFIMALGASAAQALLKTKDSVGKLRNRWHEFEGVPLRVTYHPAALLRFDGYKKDVWQDMKELTAKYLEMKGK